MRSKKRLYGGKFSGKAWYDNLDTNLRGELGIQRSMVKGCLYIYRNDTQWIEFMNYDDDALYYFDCNQTKNIFFKKLITNFNLMSMGKARWCLGMRICQNNGTITLD